MTVSQLLASLPVDDIYAVSDDFELSLACRGVCRDARAVCPDDLFFCIRGSSFDGHSAIAAAKSRGAVAAVLSDPAYRDTCPLPWICIRDTRAAFLPALLTANGNPQAGMTFYAVTGTNGKTSTVYLLDAVFSQSPAHAPTAMLGTVENRIADETFPATRTTPSPEELVSLLCRAKKRGVKTVILEASSHALVQGRLAGLSFACGIFTNLTEDHLDYHKSMEDYYRAKRRLFLSCDRALINADDLYCRRILCDGHIKAETHAFSLAQNPHPTADLHAAATQDENGTLLTLTHNRKTRCLYSPLTGSFAAYNMTAAVACAVLAGVADADIGRGLSRLVAVPGRMERITDIPCPVYIDYAHTPDALYRAVTSVNAPAGRVLLLFGCGGDREREKRPLMGSIAAKYADRCVITADNSRTEDTADIISDILSGIPENARARVTVIEDRRAAIEYILSVAAPHDTVLLCGKGHEVYQEDRAGIHPFSEKEIVLSFLKQTPQTDIEKEGL